MLSNPPAGRRTTGRIMILAAVAVALPLTATQAINYVDVSAPAPVKLAAVAAAQAVAAVKPAAPATPAHPAKPLHIDGKGAIMINGQSKQWKELTPAEKAEVRASIAEAKQELARTHIDREEIQREVREAMNDARIDQDELRRELAEARAEINQAMREIDAHADDIRRSGQDPEVIKAQVRASLKAVEAIDVEAITRSAMAAVDPHAIEASIAAAEQSVERAQDEIERIEESFERDD